MAKRCRNLNKVGTSRGPVKPYKYALIEEGDWREGADWLCSAEVSLSKGRGWRVSPHPCGTPQLYSQAGPIHSHSLASGVIPVGCHVCMRHLALSIPKGRSGKKSTGFPKSDLGPSR